MIQTTNKYSKETFIRLNYWYDRIYGLVQEDIDKVNTWWNTSKRHAPASIHGQETTCSLFPVMVSVPGCSL